MLCPVCDGSGSIFTSKHGFEWWDCPCCKDTGVRVQHGPALIGPGARKKQSARAAAE